MHQLFLWASCFPGSITFHLNFQSTVQTKTTSTSNKINLSCIPEEYYEFTDIFSKKRAEILAFYCPYNLWIKLDKNSYLPIDTIYSLSTLEQEALKKFIDENLFTSFIWFTSSSHGAPVLFAKKKNGSLQLYIDFCGLNKIIKKNQYLLPLITNLLNSPYKTYIYTKIDLCYTYHLVCITEGNKWKMVFRTCYGSFEWLVIPFRLTNTPAIF